MVHASLVEQLVFERAHAKSAMVWSGRLLGCAPERRADRERRVWGDGDVVRVEEHVRDGGDAQVDHVAVLFDCGHRAREQSAGP